MKNISIHDNSGFSLGELITVMGIMTVLAVIVIPNLIGWRSGAKLQGSLGNLTGDMQIARLFSIRESSFVVVDFSTDRYRVFVDNNQNWSLDAGERLLRDRRLPAGVRIDLGATDLSDDRTRFNDRGLPDPANLGTVFVVNTAGDQRSINLNRLGRLQVQ